MLDPKSISVLGFSHNDADAQVLSGSLERFPCNVICMPKIEAGSRDFVGDIRMQMEQQPPDIVILFIADIKSSVSLLGLIRQLAESLGQDAIYWVGVTSNTCQEQLTQHLGELDVDTFIFAPFTTEQLTVNLCTGYQHHADQLKFKKQYQQVSETARTAIEAASEIGSVMQLVDSLSRAATYEEVSQRLFKVMDGMGIKAYLQIFDGHDTYLFSNQNLNDSVQHVLSNAMHSQKRIIEHKRLLLLRLNYVIVMVSNAPWEDESRYERIKDVICQMGPTVEARVRTIMVNNLIEEQHEKVMSIMNMMRMLSSDTQNNTRAIMQDLSRQLESAALSLDLNEDQEEHLLGLSSGALDSLELLYKANDAIEGHFLTLMQSLTRVRELTNEQLHSKNDAEDDGDAIELF